MNQILNSCLKLKFDVSHLSKSKHPIKVPEFDAEPVALEPPVFLDGAVFFPDEPLEGAAVESCGKQQQVCKNLMNISISSLLKVYMKYII